MTFDPLSFETAAGIHSHKVATDGTNQRESAIVIRLSAHFIFALLFLFPLVAEGNEDRYATQIRPFLQKYCVGCHGPDKQKAELRLDTLDPDLIHGSDADMWQEVLDLINVSDMPPEDAKLQPGRARRQVVVDALTALFREATEAGRSTGGRNVLRRLTAYEYNNTLRDLLHLDLRYADDLPPEGAAPEGFKNNSSVLGTSALHLEYFERIARSASGEDHSCSGRATRALFCAGRARAGIRGASGSHSQSGRAGCREGELRRRQKEQSKTYTQAQGNRVSPTA